MQAAPAVAPEQASAEIDDQGEEERHLGERRGIRPGNHTRLVQDQERGPERENGKGCPSSHVDALNSTAKSL